MNDEKIASKVAAGIQGHPQILDRSELRVPLVLLSDLRVRVPSDRGRVGVQVAACTFFFLHPANETGKQNAGR
jgi:hypothetical protein